MARTEYWHLTAMDVAAMDRAELCFHWNAAWGLKPPGTVSTKLLVKSLLHSIDQRNGAGLSPQQQGRLDQLVAAYKRSREAGTLRQNLIAPGTRIVRDWKGKQHVVTVHQGFYEYQGRSYRSLSAIASEIAGSRWNGWTFFGVKKASRGDRT